MIMKWTRLESLSKPETWTQTSTTSKTECVCHHSVNIIQDRVHALVTPINILTHACHDHIASTYLERVRSSYSSYLSSNYGV